MDQTARIWNCIGTWRLRDVGATQHFRQRPETGCCCGKEPALAEDNHSNGLLARVDPDDLAALSAQFERVDLDQGQFLFHAHEAIEHVYFFLNGLSSEIAGPRGKEVEVGCVGAEGLSGVPALLGVDSSPHYAFMQVGGTALRIRSDALRDLMDRRPRLRWFLLRFAHVFMMQIAATSLANGRFNVEQRLARWLLMSQDRLGDRLPLTHDFFALMLGVRRPSVTDALHLLEGKRLIQSSRRLVTIRDRAGLAQLAGASYGMPETEYRRLISGHSEPSPPLIETSI
ncbi:helix-turn-helix domain-containing protein [Shinella sp. AETb1-6]|nr:helix-turn-helix domain-containing protein [Shinella sp. AETb1-6]